MSDEYKLYVMMPVPFATIHARYPVLEDHTLFGAVVPDKLLEPISRRKVEIMTDIEDIDDEKIFAALPRVRREDALPMEYEPLQKEVAIQTGHFPFDGTTMILKKYETVESYKKSNGRVGFKDLVLAVHGVTIMYEAKILIRIWDTKGMKWILGWRRSDASSRKS